jgi:hypothetical protein
MTMRKPIEAGCLAIVVGTPGCDCVVCKANRGKLVQVIVALRAGDMMRISEWVLFVKDSSWLCQSLGSRLSLDVSGPGDCTVTRRPFYENQLLRIDDPVGADETLTWTPVPTTPEKTNAPQLS